MKVDLEVNGFKYVASFTDREIENIIKPLVFKFQKMRENIDRRLVVFLAAPPAVGKSTFAVFLEKLSHELEDTMPVQHLSLDGFHYPNTFLKNNKITFEGQERYLSEIKGMPETFDLEKFKSYLEKLKYEDIKWPIYDRQIHDVKMDQINVESEIVLIEGNWLLLDEKGWRDLKEKCDYSIFIYSDEEQLKDRLINRKIKGGLTPNEAENFYKRSDRKNIYRVIENQLDADLELKLLETGEKIISEGEL